MQKEVILIVDEKDTIIGEVPREEKKDTDIHRVSALWVTNSKWEILLAKRHKNKKSNPWLWWPAVAGTNAVWETYESNIYKEAKEEIGIINVPFRISFKMNRFDAKTKHFIQWFTAKVDMDISEFQLQEDEVEEVRWWTKKELQNKLIEAPELFLKSFPRYLEMFADL